jgi:hypothetical protein
MDQKWDQMYEKAKQQSQKQAYEIRKSREAFDQERARQKALLEREKIIPTAIYHALTSKRK